MWNIRPRLPRGGEATTVHAALTERPTCVAFLPPLGVESPASRPIDRSLAPSVQVVEVHGGGAVLREIVQVASCDSPGARRPSCVNDSADHHNVELHSGRVGMSSGRLYRVNVILDGDTIGWIDLRTLEKRSELASVPPGTAAAMIGSTIPIRCRFEYGGTPTNVPPAARDDELTIDEDSSGQIDVVANDTDVNGDAISVHSFSQISSATVELGADGRTLAVTPQPDYSGTFAITYVATDGAALSNTATLRVTVLPLPDDPIAYDDRMTLLEDTPFSSPPAPSILSNDRDPDGDPLVVELVAGVAHGELALRPDGTFDCVPAPCVISLRVHELIPPPDSPRAARLA